MRGVFGWGIECTGVRSSGASAVAQIPALRRRHSLQIHCFLHRTQTNDRWFLFWCSAVTPPHCAAHAVSVHFTHTSVPCVVSVECRVLFRTLCFRWGMSVVLKWVHKHPVPPPVQPIGRWVSGQEASMQGQRVEDDARGRGAYKAKCVRLLLTFCLFFCLFCFLASLFTPSPHTHTQICIRKP